MGAPQPHKGEEPVTVQAQQTSPCWGRGYHRVGGERSDSDRQLQNTIEEPSQTRGEATAPRRPSPLRRLHSHRDHKPDTNRRPRRAVCAPPSRVAVPLTSLPLRPREGGERTKSPSFPVRSLRLTVLAASAQVLPFFLRPFSLMSGLELTVPVSGSGRPPCLLCPALFFPRCRGKVGERGSQAGGAPEQRKRQGGALGAVYGAAGPPAAVTTATAAAILGPYCTGSRYGHVTAPAQPSLLYAASRANERARAPASARGHRRASRPAAEPGHAPVFSVLSLASRACAMGRSDATLRLASFAHANSENLPAEAELGPSRKVLLGFRPRAGRGGVSRARGRVKLFPLETTLAVISINFCNLPFLFVHVHFFKGYLLKICHSSHLLICHT